MVDEKSYDLKRYYVYILTCRDASFYVGVTNNLERRLTEHRNGYSSYTKRRLPVKLEWNEEFTDINEAIRIEKKLKGWSRRKKQAMINEKWEELVIFSKNYTENKHIKINNESSTGSD